MPEPKVAACACGSGIPVQTVQVNSEDVTLGLAPNLLSHHLRTLEKAGLVHSRRDRVDGRWIYYSVDRAAAAHWQTWFNSFLNPTQIQERPVCGPEGQRIATAAIRVATD